MQIFRSRNLTQHRWPGALRLIYFFSWSNVSARRRVAFRGRSSARWLLRGPWMRHVGANNKAPERCVKLKTGHRRWGTQAGKKLRGCVKVIRKHTHIHKNTHEGNIKEAGPGTVTPRQSAALQLFGWRNKKSLQWAARWLILPDNNASNASRPPKCDKGERWVWAAAVPKLLSTPSERRQNYKTQYITDALTIDVLLSPVRCVPPSSITGSYLSPRLPPYTCALYKWAPRVPPVSPTNITAASAEFVQTKQLHVSPAVRSITAMDDSRLGFFFYFFLHPHDTREHLS